MSAFLATAQLRWQNVSAQVDLHKKRANNPTFLSASKILPNIFSSFRRRNEMSGMKPDIFLCALDSFEEKWFVIFQPMQTESSGPAQTMQLPVQVTRVDRLALKKNNICPAVQAAVFFSPGQVGRQVEIRPSHSPNKFSSLAATKGTATLRTMSKSGRMQMNMQMSWSLIQRISWQMKIDK